MINSIQRKEDCCICAEIVNRQFPEPFKNAYGIVDRICVENRHFVVFPSVSPLVTGHMLIFPKKHVPSLRELSIPLIESLQQLAVDIAKTSSQGTRSYFFEHGVLEDGKGSCGISHAHLHILPLNSSIACEVTRSASSSFPPNLSGSFISLLSSSKHRESAYLLFGENLFDLHLAIAPSIPSQFMRRVIATTMGMSTWDWKDLIGIDYFHRTLQMFGHTQFSPR